MVGADLTRDPSARLTRWSYQAHLRGVRYLGPSASEAIDGLRPGDSVEVRPQPDNEYDSRALIVRAGTQDIGWVPQGLLDDFTELRALGSTIRATVEQTNPVDTPISYRIRLNLCADHVDGFCPMPSARYQPLDPEARRTRIEVSAWVE